MKYSINESYFEKVDSEDTAYFLGLMYSDGYIVNNYFGISLLKKDKEILENQCNVLNN